MTVKEFFLLKFQTQIFLTLTAEKIKINEDGDDQELQTISNDEETTHQMMLVMLQITIKLINLILIHFSLVY